MAKVNWSLSQSADEYEQPVIEMFEQHNFHQLVDFSTCGKDTLDLVFERKVENTTAKIDLVFKQLFNVLDHDATKNEPVSFQGYKLYQHPSHD